MTIRDLTLRSAASFGSFHLIRLLYDEYMFYLVEHRVARSLGLSPVAVIGLGRMSSPSSEGYSMTLGADMAASSSSYSMAASNKEARVVPKMEMGAEEGDDEVGNDADDEVVDEEVGEDEEEEEDGGQPRKPGNGCVFRTMYGKYDRIMMSCFSLTIGYPNPSMPTLNEELLQLAKQAEFQAAQADKLMFPDQPVMAAAPARAQLATSVAAPGVNGSPKQGYEPLLQAHRTLPKTEPQQVRK